MTRPSSADKFPPPLVMTDPLTLFSGQAGWLLNKLGLSAELDPVKGMGLVNTAALAFLADHLPLGEGTRGAQTWSKDGAWSLLAAHVEAEATRPSKGPLSWYDGVCGSWDERRLTWTVHDWVPDGPALATCPQVVPRKGALGDPL